MGLRSPSVLALDQLDSIVARYRSVADVEANSDNPPDEQSAVAIAAAKLIVEDVGNGLLALRDKTSRTLAVVSCVEGTWEVFRDLLSRTVTRRFQDHIVLKAVNKRNFAEEIVAKRLSAAYQKLNFLPPYPTWPFSSEFLDSALGFFPSEILWRCHEHRETCLAQGKVTVLNSFRGEKNGKSSIPLLQIDFSKLDKAFALHKEQINPADAFEEDNEDSVLGKWLQTACYCLIQENPISDAHIIPTWEVEFSGLGNYPSLHGRVSLVFQAENDREKYLCLRALQKSHHKAYQPRLKAAIAESGIDKVLEDSRRLILVRTHPIPSGRKNQELTRKLRESGGLFEYPSEDELCTLGALQKIRDSDEFLDFDQWLRDRRPVSQLPFIQDSVNWLFKGVNISNSRDSNVESKVQMAAEKRIISEEDKARTLLGALSIGNRLVGQQTKETISIRSEDLTKHAVILAGSGSGKTVLVRRIVEEAALMGIPAIVIDVANDLARLGDSWPTPPKAWQAEDIQKAERYNQITQAIVWTPGREAANPLNLNPLPDFAAVANDPDELNLAIDMARDSLQDIVAPGKSKSAKIGQGILRNALEYFAQNSGGNLEDLAMLLSDLPIEAGGGISNPQKKSQEMADLLNAEISNNPLLRQSGTDLDPAVLFGLDNPDKTRISVINFFGLTSLPQQQQFLNQLAMTLFTWIKKNPAPTNRPLRGLLVIDEAKDFVPSGKSTACKSSIIRLAAQARKYGLGLIFATQAPKSIDHNIIANCSTQFYGRANSPAAIQVIQEQLSQRGSSGQDIPKLEKGQFYAVSESFKAPIKILAPLCLSHHPSTPLNDEEVTDRAAESRDSLHIRN